MHNNEGAAVLLCLDQGRWGGKGKGGGCSKLRIFRAFRPSFRPLHEKRNRMTVLAGIRSWDGTSTQPRKRSIYMPPPEKNPACLTRQKCGIGSMAQVAIKLTLQMARPQQIPPQRDTTPSPAPPRSRPGQKDRSASCRRTSQGSPPRARLVETQPNSDGTHGKSLSFSRW